MADEKYWTYKASVPAPSFADAKRAGINVMTEQEWYKLSPGMRREIYRQQQKNFLDSC